MYPVAKNLLMVYSLIFLSQQYTEIALRVAKELHCYHQTVADILKPLHFSDFPEDFENATLTNVHGKDEVLSAWTSICEVSSSQYSIFKSNH